MNLPQTGFASINNANIYYETAGEGEPLLLIHAGVADSRMWQANIEQLAQNYHTICYDVPGFGRTQLTSGTFSQHEIVKGLLDYFGFEQAHIVGISYGGLITLDFALAYPQRVKKLVLCAPSVSGHAPTERIVQFWEDEEALLKEGKIDEAVELNLRLWVDGVYRRPEEVNPAVRQLVGEMQKTAFLIEFPEDIKQVGLEPPASGRLAEIQAPALLISGALDLPEKLTLADEIMAVLPQATQVVIPDTAHLMTMEAPKQFNEVLLSFLQK